MTSRSIVLGTAALLFLSAATPMQFGFSPTAAYAQQVSKELREALTGDPARLQPRQLSEHIRVLRDAIEAGVLQGEARRAAREKMEAYREVLQQHRGQRQAAGQDDQQAGQQGEQPRRGERAQRQRSERQAEKAERRAEKAEQQAQKRAGQDQRKAERQAEKALQQAQKRAEQEQRRAEQQARTQQQAQQAQQARQAQQERQARQAQQERQAQQARQAQQERQARQAQQERQARQEQAALSREVIAALRDNRPAQALERAELRNRIQMLRAAEQSGALSRDQRRQVVARIQADSEVFEAARGERQQETATQQPRQQRSERTRTREMPKEEVDRRARAIISDRTPARDLDNQVLRKRLADNREILATGKLSRAEERDLRQQLRQDREELRGRVASRQERPRRRDSGDQAADTGRNATAVIEQRTPADRLSDRELERRVRELNRALREERIARRDAEAARQMVERDRSELRRRLHSDRDRRRERRRDARSRNEAFIDFHVGFQPPPVIFAAEAMPRDIEIQLVAPPMQRLSRSYTVREIAASPDVREMMPGIEIDTLNFDFGSAEVRPEEIDKLDDIADVIERIVAERPDEVFLLEGHTDAVGSHAANDVLSQRRAEAVMEALLDYYEIYPENLQTVGLGKRYLKIWTEEAEEENRRVTVRRITPLLVGGRG